jgi:hypothetical protein
LCCAPRRRLAGRPQVLLRCLGPERARLWLPAPAAAAQGSPRRNNRVRGARKGSPCPPLSRAQRGLSRRPRAIAPAAFRALWRVQDEEEPSGDRILRGSSRFYTLSPRRCTRARRSGRSRRQARPSAATGEGGSTTPPRLLLLRKEARVPVRERHPSRENENRRTARGNRTPTAGTRVPSHSFRPERL